jgi:hypothetical protein
MFRLPCADSSSSNRHRNRQPSRPSLKKSTNCRQTSNSKSKKEVRAGFISFDAKIVQFSFLFIETKSKSQKKKEAKQRARKAAEVSSCSRNMRQPSERSIAGGPRCCRDASCGRQRIQRDGRRRAGAQNESCQKGVVIIFLGIGSITFTLFHRSCNRFPN